MLIAVGHACKEKGSLYLKVGNGGTILHHMLILLHPPE